MELLRRGLIYFSYAYHGVLALFLSAIGFLAIVTSSHTLQMEFLPGSGTTLSYELFFVGLIGLALILLAFTGRLRFLFFFWSLAVLLVQVKGYVSPSYIFEPGQLSTAVCLVIGALVAVAGAWFRMRATPVQKKKYY